MMSKRKVTEDAEVLTSKRLQIEPSTPPSSLTQLRSLEGCPLLTAPSSDCRAGHDNDTSDYALDDTTSHSADTPRAATNYTPSTTAASSRSRKFPSDLKTIKCTFPDCDKTFNRPARLAAHLRSHNDDRPFKCTHDGCDKSYREEKHLRQHVKGSHSQERAYTCTVEGCGKSFLTATRLRRHQDVHAGQERFRCRDYPPCAQTFRKHGTLQRHIRAEHQGGRAFMCQEEGCEAGFDSQGALRNHKKREHSEARFWCEECGGAQDGQQGEGAAREPVGFFSLTQLQTHIRKEHLQCVFCDQKCRGQSELEAHVELHHSGIPVEARKTIACPRDGCDKKFTKRNNLNAHIRSAHEGVRFVCGEVDLSGTPDLQEWPNENGCGSDFVSKATLEIHVRHVHMGVPRPKPNPQVESGRATNVIDDVAGTKRNIPCSVTGCSERFIRNHDLQLHLAHHPQVATQQQEAAVVPESIEAEVLRLADAPSTNYNDMSTSNDITNIDMDYSSRMMPELPFLGVSQDIVYRTAPAPGPHVSSLDQYPDGLGDDVFWIGADGNTLPADESLQQERLRQGDEDAWYEDEAAMRALIDEEFDRFVDPALNGGSAGDARF